MIIQAKNKIMVIFIRTCLIAASTFFPFQISGQMDVKGLDSVAINKPKSNKNLYQFNDPGSKEIQFRIDQPQKTHHQSGKKILNDLGAELATGITGIGFGSSTDMYWKTRGIIKCNDSLPDWFVDLNCEGILEKERERVRDEDGSWSVETQTTKTFYWDKNATGIILEKNDTIGYFLIIMNPRENPIFKLWSPYVFSEKDVSSRQVSKSNFYFSPSLFIAPDYGITGKFREMNFTMISNGTAFRTYIFSDNELLCIFQPDRDDIPFMKKKDRIPPVLFISKRIPDSDRRDLFRLAIMSRILGLSFK